MNQLVNVMQNTANKTTTLNGAKAFKSTKNACLDLFSSWGGMRGQDASGLVTSALQENPVDTGRILLWGRDVRGGAGERKLFRDNLLLTLSSLPKHKIKSFIKRIPEVGRWDDLEVLFNTQYKHETLAIWSEAIFKQDGLACKWAARKGYNAVALTKYMNLTPKQYRKLIVSGSNTVEQKMCAQQWKYIEYKHVPSKSMALYHRAFNRHDTHGFSEYKNNLVTGKEKVNANAIYPHEITRVKDEQLRQAMWDAQPNWVKPEQTFIPLIDVSGSMNGTPMEIAIALGVYLAERNKSVFKDLAICFTSEAQIVKLSGNLTSKLYQTETLPWGGSTNINKAFKNILTLAVNNKIKQSDMPESLIILSDMQFDKNEDYGNKTNFQHWKKEYTNAGYKLPTVVFWNLRDYGNKPVKENTENAVLVSGFSPSMMKSLITGEEVTPLEQMYKTIMDNRYNY